MIPPLLAYGPEPAGCFSGNIILLLFRMHVMCMRNSSDTNLILPIFFLGLFCDYQCQRF